MQKNWQNIHESHSDLFGVIKLMQEVILQPQLQAKRKKDLGTRRDAQVDSSIYLVDMLPSFVKTCPLMSYQCYIIQTLQ